MSQAAEFAPGKALRGGVPVIFPQFGLFGPGPKHGFARNKAWQFNAAASHGQKAVLQLEQDTTSYAQWPHAFSAVYCVNLAEQSLELALTITNTHNQPFQFTSALHSYFRLQDLAQSEVTGLANSHYWDNGTDFSQRSQQMTDSLCVRDALDRVYFNTQQPLHLHQPQHSLRIASTGFDDTVIWNPGAAGAAALPDMQPSEYRSMLCIESAAVANPITLAPGESWCGVQHLTVEGR